MPIERLPTEVLSHVMGCIKDQSCSQINNLKSCCLVSRRWLGVAQPVLFREATLRNGPAVVKFHEALKSSDKFGPLVRDLRIDFETRDTTGLRLGKMIADCLERTSKLASFASRAEASRHITNQVADRLSCLKDLMVLQLEQTNDPIFVSNDHAIVDGENVGEDVAEDHTEDFQGDGAEDAEKKDSVTKQTQDEPDVPFDAANLLLLPKTLKCLSLCYLSEDLLDLLPLIFANIKGDSDTASHPFEQTGVLALLLTTDLGSPRRASMFFSQLALSLASTLTAFSFSAITPMDAGLNGFLSACSMLSWLDLRSCVISEAFFDSLQPMRRLRHLKLGISSFPTSLAGEWERCCESMANFISHSPINTFHFRSGTKRAWPMELDSLMIPLLKATTSKTSPHFSRLRRLALSDLEPLSIEVFEHLCILAPGLQSITFDRLPSDRTRFINAIGRLPHLQSANLNGCSLYRDLDEPSLNVQPLLDFWAREAQTSQEQPSA